ncbi:unnamed protein product, partial [Pleuronectes platessa]
RFSWAALEEISDDLALHSKTQVIREGSSHRSPPSAPSHPLPTFKCQGKVKALRMHSPDLTTRQAGGAGPLPAWEPLTTQYPAASLWAITSVLCLGARSNL